jgi:predicted GNAT superfamily acetyltransferase
MEFEIKALAEGDLECFREIGALQRLAWGFADLEVSPTHVLHAAVKTGGQVLAAYDKKKL